ncbi:MAG: lytic transglycosylase domain-containing protein [Planctomycetota bacterium]|nr:lytic transglycosylase domain-containing protein [Planctomycetota bacterium]MDP6763511.1 lytic transglycosylase domain-containing protein [Planctomycetota bacterium]MDP6990802.1 lytic transglycosylase domain-containing protein [Planctomycetota bacterium]
MTSAEERTAARAARPGAVRWVVAALGLAAVVAIALWPMGNPRRGALERAVGGLFDQLALGRVEAHAAAIRLAAAESGLDPCLIGAVCYAESRGRVDALSSVGAAGLMQLMPDAAADASRALGLEEPTRAELRSDARLNLRLGARHLAWTLEHEDGEVERALVAYNAGRTTLRRWIKAAGSYTLWRERQLADGDSGVLTYALGVLACRETLRARGKIDGPDRSRGDDAATDPDS